MNKQGIRKYFIETTANIITTKRSYYYDIQGKGTICKGYDK